MKAVMLMFDTLTRNHLAPYGGDAITPNFTRLAQASAQFDNFYVGSMPCMPARRELHTGRYNFLHRSWGPLEPFDFSAMQALRQHGVQPIWSPTINITGAMAGRPITLATPPLSLFAARKVTAGKARWKNR